jgi:hypothetical protein
MVGLHFIFYAPVYQKLRRDRGYAEGLGKRLAQCEVRISNAPNAVHETEPPITLPV